MIAIEQLSTELASDSGMVRAVDALSLTIESGQTFALVGESGCGKSMTALSLLRLLPDSGRVTAGTVTLDGTELMVLPERSMRNIRGRRISIIFQEPATSLNPVMTVGQQIVEVIERHTALLGAAAKAKAVQWLERVGIADAAQRIDSYPFQMSGGQKQRVMVAIALAAEPDVVIADEPTTALDVTIQAQILDLLRALQKSQKMAMLLITHDLAVVAQMAHRVALMYAGQIVEVASAPAFFAKPRHPYAVNLLDALPDAQQRGKRLAAIAGTVPPLHQVFAGCRFADRCTDASAQCLSAPPALVAVQADHAVRCVLYQAGQDQALATRNAVSSPGVVRAPLAPSTGVPLLQVQDYRVWFPIRKGLLQRTVGHVKAVDGVSFSLHSGRTLALVGSPAAARPPWARACSNSCAAAPRSAAARCSTARRCRACRARACAKRAAPCRLFSKTRLPRSIRVCASTRYWRRAWLPCTRRSMPAPAAPGSPICSKKWVCPKPPSRAIRTSSRAVSVSAWPLPAHWRCNPG